MGETFIITSEWLHQHATQYNGFTRAQLEVLGVKWPPRKGWLRAAIGHEIPITHKIAFEQRRTQGRVATCVKRDPVEEARIVRARQAAREAARRG